MTATAIEAGTKPIASRWIGASFAGWTIGFVLSIVLLVGVESAGVRHTQFPLALGMGLGVGFTQARVIGPVLGGRSAWVLTSGLGLAVPFIVMDLLQVAGVPVPFALAPYVGLGGLVVALLQSRILARVSTRALRWVPGATLAWLLGGSMAFAADALSPLGLVGLTGALAYIAVILMGGVLLGAIQGALLRGILQAPADRDDGPVTLASPDACP